MAYFFDFIPAINRKSLLQQDYEIPEKIQSSVAQQILKIQTPLIV